jgi:putative ABC transport system permease protein
MFLLAAFGLLALSLAAVGISGVVSYSVAQRTQEIGIRMALGARTVDVLRLAVGRSMAWALVGVAVGIAGACLLARLLASLLFGVQPADPRRAQHRVRPVSGRGRRGELSPRPPRYQGGSDHRVEV